MGGTTAESVLHVELDERVGQDLLNAGALDLAGSEGVTDDSGIFRQHGLDATGSEFAAIERAEVGELTGRP